MAEVRMPKMGDGMEQGTINAWLKREGQQVTSGESIAEVETDKANVEIPAYESGVLTKIVVQVGQTVPVGEVIAVIGSPGGASNGSQPSAASAESDKANGASAKAAPAAAEKANGAGAAPVQSAPKGAAPAPPSAERVKSSPLARRMASELSIDLARVTGTGPGGRVVERDIKAFQENHPAGVAPPTAMPAATAEAAPAQESRPSKMREAIARRTVLSKQTIPHFYVTMIVEMDAAQALLSGLNAGAESKITVNDLIVKACAVALARVPEVNATWTPEGTVRRFAEAHIGVAVGIDDGLIIPVIRECHAKTLRQISADAKLLIGKARRNQLTPAEYSGGTFSVSNLGMMGVDEFTAIINPPEAAILAIGTIAREPVVGDGDQVVIRSRMKITISADHRLCDGVIAARFVQEVKKALEAPLSLLS
ncbi:MAG TPA: dihydrolipoamide acetyltransferase family protein [Chthonomonadaceae bacterium]|nr:dihydrolipoamide acetyltransferase family protein [Chthonomonadaceae bacterium]